MKIRPGRAASRKIHEEPGVGIDLHRIVTDGGHPGPDAPRNKFVYYYILR